MKLNFRPLKAEEIECRVATVKKTGVSLLLYKDARVDMRLLDETVGVMNWKRSHQLIDGNLYCTIEIWDDEKKQWIGKQDVGTESYTEKEKGQASDSFKRAAFNVGIGRELYTAPFIWIPSSKCQIEEKGNGYTCYDRFDVKSISIADGNIVALDIVNEKTGNLVFSWSTGKAPARTTEERPGEKQMLDAGAKKINAAKQKALEKWFKDLNIDSQEVLGAYGAKTFSDLTEDAHFAIMRMLAEAEEKLKKKDGDKVTEREIDALMLKVKDSGVDLDRLLALYKISQPADMTFKKYNNMLANWEKIMEKCK